MELEDVKKIMGDHDGVILQFTGQGYGLLVGVTEYITIVTDADDLEEVVDPAPGFELSKAVPVDGEDLDSLPCTRVLAVKM